MCLVGYFDNLEASTDAISFGAVRVNNSFCTNPDYRIKPLDVISLDMQTYLEIRSTRLFNLVNTHLAKPDVTLDVKRRVLGDAAEFLKKYSSVARLRGEGYSVTKFLFFKNLLSATVTKIKDRKKKLYTRRKLDKKAKTARKRPFFKKPRSGAGQGPLLRPNYYSKGDLGSGVAYEKISVNPASSPSDAFYTPSKIRRLLLRALKGDAAGLSSSIPTANDIFYQFNNIVIYLRRPHTINEMFEKSSIKTSATYNSEVIEEFYTSRF